MTSWTFNNISKKLIFTSWVYIKNWTRLSGHSVFYSRRNSDWDEIQVIFSKIVSIFPAKVKEVFLLYQYPEGKRERERQVEKESLIYWFCTEPLVERKRNIDRESERENFIGSAPNRWFRTNKNMIERWMLREGEGEKERYIYRERETKNREKELHWFGTNRWFRTSEIRMLKQRTKERFWVIKRMRK